MEKLGERGLRGFIVMHLRPLTSSVGCIVMGSQPMSTNNNTASRHKLSPGEPVDKHGLHTLFITATVVP